MLVGFAASSRTLRHALLFIYKLVVSNLDMKNKKEFLELRNVSDYWKDSLWEYENLKNNPNDVYFAFNFIVTGWHITDWYHKAKFPEDNYNTLKSKIDLFVKSNPIVKISEHLANGAKHFEVSFNKHNSVKKATKERYFEEDYVEEGYTEDPIMIYLNEEFDSEFGDSVKLSDYSSRLVIFWKNILSSDSLI